MAGALMTMPMLVINMGAEMVYVLDQRLKAQNIPREKSAKGERASERATGDGTIDAGSQLTVGEDGGHA